MMLSHVAGPMHPSPEGSIEHTVKVMESEPALATNILSPMTPLVPTAIEAQKQSPPLKPSSARTLGPGPSRASTTDPSALKSRR